MGTEEGTILLIAPTTDPGVSHGFVGSCSRILWEAARGICGKMPEGFDYSHVTAGGRENTAVEGLFVDQLLTRYPSPRS